MHCNTWHDKYLCGINLCDWRLIRTIRINKSHAEICHFTICACALIVYTSARLQCAGVDDRHWKTVSGEFTSIVSCPNVCYSMQAPRGMSPYGHLGNGCTDLILLQKCSTMAHAKWLMKQRWGPSQVRERRREREGGRERERERGGEREREWGGERERERELEKSRDWKILHWYH